MIARWLWPFQHLAIQSLISISDSHIHFRYCHYIFYFFSFISLTLFGWMILFSTQKHFDSIFLSLFFHLFRSIVVKIVKIWIYIDKVTKWPKYWTHKHTIIKCISTILDTKKSERKNKILRSIEWWSMHKMTMCECVVSMNWIFFSSIDFLFD